jgi:hypothetical protein
MSRNTGYVNTNPNLVSGLESLYGKDSIQKASESKTLDEEALEKGEEGSKGGHVIGHTKSGKPIYANLHEFYQGNKEK